MIRFLLFASLLVQATCAKNSPKANPQAWQTLNGDEPLVIAKGGLSGVFPESSQTAIEAALPSSLPSMVVYCSMLLSKDGIGFCGSDSITLDNFTNVADIYPKQQKTYNVNGQDQRGWFSVDLTSKELFGVSYKQAASTRPAVFDGSFPLASVEDAIGEGKNIFWLNVQHDMFYKQHKLSPASYLQTDRRLSAVNYISSPEVDFLKAMNRNLNRQRTKLVFRIEQGDQIEPTTKKPYSSLMKDLGFIKSFASGILVPKEHIWPVTKDLYLEDATSLVIDAHKAGLEVYAYGFANDRPASYNYSFDPTAEYLQFVDNAKFSVDGVLTEFPPTASAAVGCLAHNKNNRKKLGGKNKNFLVISSNGASGVYAASTDLAYQQAVDDGADIIDCSVQMSKDGVAFCSRAPNLIKDTTAATTYMDRTTKVTEIEDVSGIYSFDLTWSEIQMLKPQLSSTLPKDLAITRNPANKNKGKFMTLEEFLAFAKAKNVTGILVNIENAAYLASQKGLSITDAAAGALRNASFDTQSTQRVLIQSDDSAVLTRFKNAPSYKKVLRIKNAVSDAPKQLVQEIKKYADAVTVTRTSIVQSNPDFFTSKGTHLVEEMHAANLSVYVGVLKNEYVSIFVDYFSDPMIELASFAQGYDVDGFITEYPRTAVTYLSSPCADMERETGFAIAAVEAGSLLKQLVPQGTRTPPAAPTPALTAADVISPPLPALADNKQQEVPQNAPSAKAPAGSSGAPELTMSFKLSLLVIAVTCFIFIMQ